MNSEKAFDTQILSLLAGRNEEYITVDMVGGEYLLIVL